MQERTFTVNDRTYTMPDAPVVVICVDGSEPAYHRDALKAGRMPWLDDALRRGASSWPAECALPALTNPNNVSIATGQPPRVHGISGNYFYDPHSGTEVLMNDARFLRIPTIFAEAARCGLDVAVVTAKEKLRRLLGSGLVGQSSAGDQTSDQTRICFSAENADTATIGEHGVAEVLGLVGRPLPEVYSSDLSEFVLAAGVKLLRSRHIDLMYLSLTDFIQHKHPPGSDTANDFYAMIDSYVRELDETGAVVVITADHGMNAKARISGSPLVVYVEDEVRRMLNRRAKSTSMGDIRVVLPITDPYTAHHGALGSCAYVYLPQDVDADDFAAELEEIDGVAIALPRERAAKRYDLPNDRIGDVVVMADAATVLGRNADWHDLSGLDAPLRSHGGVGEISVPFIINRTVPRPERLHESHGSQPAYVHNYDAIWVATTLVSNAAVDAANCPAATHLQI